MELLKKHISSKTEPVYYFVLVLTIVMILLILDAILNLTSIRQMTGPAIGAIIAVYAGYLFSRWSEDNKEIKRKAFLAHVFLFELEKIQKFIAGIQQLNIKSEDFLITRPPIIDGGFLKKDPRPEWDEYKRRALLKYFHDNEYIRITESAPLISKRSPFEIFTQEIYVFQDSELVFQLLKVDSLLIEANTSLLDFHKIWETSDGHLDLFNFMTKLERIKPEVEKILSEGKLESISKTV